MRRLILAAFAVTFAAAAVPTRAAPDESTDPIVVLIRQMKDPSKPQPTAEERADMLRKEG